MEKVVEAIVDYLLRIGISPIYFFAAIMIINAVYLVKTNTPERKRQVWQQYYVFSAALGAAAGVVISLLHFFGVLAF